MQQDLEHTRRTEKNMVSLHDVNVSVICQQMDLFGKAGFSGFTTADITTESGKVTITSTPITTPSKATPSQLSPASQQISDIAQKQADEQIAQQKAGTPKRKRVDDEKSRPKKKRKIIQQARELDCIGYFMTGNKLTQLSDREWSMWVYVASMTTTTPPYFQIK